ncbi:MAG: alginate lyase family protein [Chloroflexota bacterium]
MMKRIERSISLYLGDEARARTVLEAARERRIAAQIEPSGQQPRELARTKAWSYSVFNLDAMFNLAALGERAGVDLWNYESPDGRGMRRALDWLLPYALGSQPWTAQQITPFVPGELYPLLRRASVAYGSATYRAAAARIAPTPADADRRVLTIPFAP